jgi:hypothetical protein
LQDRTALAERTAPSFMARTARGEWPSVAEDLPLLLTEQQLAHLRGVTVRTLQRERRLKLSIPYIRDGRKIRYARHHVLERFGLSSAP